MVDEGLVYVVMTERTYPVRLAVQYLEAVANAFKQELRQEHGGVADGTDMQWKQAIATADKPYAYIRFERTITRLRREFQDSSSSSNVTRLKDDLSEVHSIMRRSIAEVLGRGEKLESVSRTSAALRSESDKFYKGAKKANRLDLLRTYGTYAMVVLFIIAVIYWRFFW